MEIYAEDIDPNVKNDIIHKVKELSTRIDNRDQLVSELKAYLDDKYGSSWHVVMTDNSFWLQISCTPEYSIHFRLDDCSFLIWMTSDQITNK